MSRERGNFKFRFKALDLRISFKVVRIVYHDFLTLGLRFRFKDFYKVPLVPGVAKQLANFGSI